VKGSYWSVVTAVRGQVADSRTASVAGWAAPGGGEAEGDGVARPGRVRLGGGEELVGGDVRGAGGRRRARWRRAEGRHCFGGRRRGAVCR
jgi:hypothetical protein